MGIFDALNGKILHFNTTVIPISNRLMEGVKNSEYEEGKLFLILLCQFAYKGVEIIFNPDGGWLWKKVKEYNRRDYESLFALLFVWEAPVIIRGGVVPKRDFYKEVQRIVNMKDDYFNRLISLAENDDEFESEDKFAADRAEKLWNLLSDILKVDKISELDNFLIFMSQWGRIKKQTMESIVNKG